MKKRQFLAPLAVSVSALLGAAAIPAQASNTPAVTVAYATAPALDNLVLTRGAGDEIRFADHGFHASHELHVSHASHSSHVSGS